VDEVGPGQAQLVVRVPLSVTVRVCQWLPVWPVGQPTSRPWLDKAREMATLVAAGAVQVAAQVLDTTVQADVLETGEPVAVGHDQLVVWDSVITPLWPDGQD